MRSRGKKDNNQDEIVEQCRKAGMFIYPFSQYRGHYFDLLIGYKEMWLPFEVKKSAKSRITKNEANFQAACILKHLPIIHATCFKDILIAFEQELNK